jgi:hypothetical protein
METNSYLLQFGNFQIPLIYVMLVLENLEGYPQIDIQRAPEGCFKKIAKLNHSESQNASQLLFLGSMPDLIKQNKQKNKQGQQVKKKNPVSNLIQTPYQQGPP